MRHTRHKGRAGSRSDQWTCLDARAVQQYQHKNRVDDELVAAQSRLSKLKAAADDAKQLTSKQPHTQANATNNSRKHTTVHCTGEAGSAPQNSTQATSGTAEAGRSSVPASLHSITAAAAAGPALASTAAKAPAVVGRQALLSKFGIFPSRASVSGDAAADCGSRGAQGQTQSGSTSSRSPCSTSRSNNGSAQNSAGTHANRHQLSSNARQRQQLQQMSRADHILSSIDAYVAGELAHAHIAAHASPPSPQNQATCASPTADQVDNDPLTSSSIGSNIPQPAEAPAAEYLGATGVVDTAAAKAAALQALGMDCEEYTPELMASLALRFQTFNAQQGLNDMPDLGTIALAVQQAQQEATQQQRQQEEAWLKQQDLQQLARQRAANRHLHLYQLGVVQQRKRLQQSGIGLMRPHRTAGRQQVNKHLAAGGVAQERLKQQLQVEQQQPHDFGVQGADMETTAACSACAVRPAGHDAVRSDAHGCTVLVNAAAERSTQPTGPYSRDQANVQGAPQPHPDCQDSPAVAVAATTAAEDQQEVAASAPSRCSVSRLSSLNNGQANAAVSAAAAGCSASAHPPSSPAAAAAAFSTSDSTSVIQTTTISCRCQDDNRAHITIACPQSGCTHPTGSLHYSTVSALTASAAPYLAGMKQALSNNRPSCTRDNTELPWPPAGASHGHLSPANLKLERLPGSTRQVYAQIQDALACSHLIATAEQNMRALTYAPCSGGLPCSAANNRNMVAGSCLR